MNPNSLALIRAQMGVTQAVMAEAMGLPKRTYEDLEAGRAQVRPVHISAARWGCLVLAGRENFKGRIPEDVRATVAAATRV